MKKSRHSGVSRRLGVSRAAHRATRAGWECCSAPARRRSRRGTCAGARRRFWNKTGSPYLRKPSAYRIVYVQSHVRTRQWFKDGEA